MAGNTGSDGSITFDTRLDTSGFKKGTDRLNSAIASFSRQVSTLSKELQTAFSKGAKPEAIEKIKAKMAEAQNQAETLRDRIMAFGQTEIRTDEYNRVCAEIEKTDKALQRLYDRQEKLKTMGADQASEQWQKLQKEISETTSKLNFYKQGMKEAQEFLREMQSPEAVAEAVEGGPEAWADYKAGIENAKEEVKANREEVDKLDAALTKLLEKQEQMKAKGADQGSKQWQSLQYDIERTRELQDQLNASREQMENNGTATSQVGDSSEFQELLNNLNSTDERLSGLKSRLASFGGIGSRAVGFVRDEMKNLAKQTLQAYINLMKMAGKAVVNGLKKLYSGAMKATKALLALNSSSKKSNMGFQHGLKTLLRYGLGIRSLFVLFNRLRAAIKESFQYIAQFDEPTNKVISSLLTALNRLKNSLGAAFQPIVTAVGPYLTMLMNMMSDAMTKVAEFMAMLTGQSYYLKATAVQTDYAKSLEKTTKATNKNANATKKAERQLASFDKLNILSGSKSKDTNTGANEIDPSKDPSKMFQKIPVSGVSDLLKRLREAFANGDYEGIGHIIGEKLNGVFARLSDFVKWDSIGPTIKKYIDLICGVINGMVDSINWPLIGSTFANGINSLLNSMYLLVTGIRWDEMGAAIGQGLSAMAAGIDWETEPVHNFL